VDIKRSSNKILGKGLATLLGEASMSFNNTKSEFRYIRLENIVPNKDQPRKNIPYDSLVELTLSIKAQGVLQPIIVQSISKDRYQIIVGERRWRAAKEANFLEIPALVKKYNPAQEFEVALIENVQRQDLDPMEEAKGYLRLTDEFKYTQEEIGNLLGKSRSYIANILRLNSLPSFVQKAIIERKISPSHAKNLVGLDKKLAQELLDTIISKNLNVRQIELLTQKQKNTKSRSKKQKSEFAELESMLSDQLKVSVNIEAQGSGGQIKILFANMIELDSILTRIK